MQPASMLGVGPVQGIRLNPSYTNNLQIGASSGFSGGVEQHQASHPQQQHSFFEKLSRNQSKMDDFLEQMFALPSWPETGGSKAPWDYSGGDSGIVTTSNTETGSGMLGSRKFMTSLMPSGIIDSLGSQDLSSQDKEIQGSNNHAQVDEAAHDPFEGRLRVFQNERATGVQPCLNGRSGTFQHGSQEAAPDSFGKISEGTASKVARPLQINTGNSIVGNPSGSQGVAAVVGSSQRGPGLARSAVGSCGNEVPGSLHPLQDNQLALPSIQTWHQPYMGRALQPPADGHAKSETLMRVGTSIDDQFGKRPQNDDEVQAGAHESMFTSFGGAKVGQVQTARAGSQHSHHQTGQAILVTPIGSRMGVDQPQSAAAVGTGTIRPRVRARRGQATAPHSIAERLRRERIAERMKALQELIPNSNKTDKASMLDEIIEYVTFLQHQVKVLSLSRLGGAAAVAPLVTDFPVEGHNIMTTSSLGRNVGALCAALDGMGATERHIARLMEEDMGSAMQYLQGKGLCLVPLSLVTTISSTNPWSQSNAQDVIHCVTASGERSLVDVLASTAVESGANSVTSGVVVSSAFTSSEAIGSDSTINGGKEGTQSSKGDISSSARLS